MLRIAVALVIASVAPAVAGPYAVGIQAYVRCVDGSFMAQRQQTPDLALAAETAMAACATQEDAIFADGALSPADERRLRITVRAKMKARLGQAQ